MLVVLGPAGALLGEGLLVAPSWRGDPSRPGCNVCWGPPGQAWAWGLPAGRGRWDVPAGRWGARPAGSLRGQQTGCVLQCLVAFAASCPCAAERVWLAGCGRREPLAPCVSFTALGSATGQPRDITESVYSAARKPGARPGQGPFSTPVGAVPTSLRTPRGLCSRSPSLPAAGPAPHTGISLSFLGSHHQPHPPLPFP